MGDKKRITKKEIQALMQRIQAVFENYKKRAEKEKLEFVKYACAGFAVKLLPIVDSFEHAIKNSADDGMKLLYSQLIDVLSKEGLQRIDCVGKLFDPYVHEAMMQAVSDKESGTILEELQAGFMFNDAVIRPAKVKVAKNEDKKKDAPKGSA